MSRSLRLIVFGWLMATFLVMFLRSKPTPVSVAAQATRGDPAPSVAIPGEWASDELTFETQGRGQGRFSIQFTVEADPHEIHSGKLITSATAQVSACGYAFALDLVAKRTPYLFFDEFELIGNPKRIESLEVSGHFPSPSTVEGIFILNISDCHAEGKWAAKRVSNTPAPTPAPATKSARTVLGNLLLAETIVIQDERTGWMGDYMSESRTHYTLKRGDSSFVGTEDFFARDFAFDGSTIGKPGKATWDITIPLDGARKFLQRLMDTPLQTGKYRPMIVTDMSGFTTIEIVTSTQTTTFFSSPALEGRSPWKVTINASGTVVQYVSDSPIPWDALEALIPLLKRGSGLPG